MALNEEQRQVAKDAGRQRAWYPFLIIFLVMALSMVGVFGWISRVDHRREDAEREARAALIVAEREADQRWCTLLVELDDAYKAGPPPTGETGKRIAEAIHGLRLGLGC